LAMHGHFHRSTNPFGGLDKKALGGKSITCPGSNDHHQILIVMRKRGSHFGEFLSPIVMRILE
jgi:hypothetical protein